MSCSSPSPATEATGLSRRHLAAAGALGLLAPGLLHSQASPHAAPPELDGMRLQGAAQMRYFGFLIYDIWLWVREPVDASNWAGKVLALELQYARRLNGREIARRSLAEMRRQAEITAPQAQRWLATMQASFPDVQPGDRICGLHEPAAGAQFFVNGRASQRVAELEFSRLFFGIWLSPQSSEPGLREQLLALARA